MALTNSETEQITAFSYSGCSWLMTYHLGVCESMHRHLDPSKYTHMGASSGSLVALIMTAKIDPKVAYDFCQIMARRSKSKFFGPFGQMTSYLLDGLKEVLPKLEEIDTHRLKVSVTKVRGLKNEIFPKSKPETMEELINIILASCYIPIYYEKPIFISKTAYLDGGVSDNTPYFDRLKTVIISPKPSLQKATIDIFPVKEPLFKHAVFPDEGVLKELFEQGKEDGAAYFSKNEKQFAS